MPPNSISEMLAGSCVFVTGCTGFVGGCLLERICKLEPGPARIFVLVRERRGVDAPSRLKRMFSSPLFSGLPERKLERVQALSGDVGSDAPDLGLSDSDLRLLLDCCTHIFHSAAFISFAAEIDEAIKVNLRGSRAVLKLAKRMRKLRAMVHVSTAYINCTRGSENSTFREKLASADVDPLDVLKAVEEMSPRDIEVRFADSIGRHPNTYSFTKRLTENLLARERGPVPLAFVRPSIILNSWREPFSGWVDNVNSGACGFIAGAGKGVFCTLLAKANKVMDVIPVDMVVSTILAAGLKAELEPKTLHIFHCTSSAVNPTTWGRYVEGIVRGARKHPCENNAWYPRVTLRENWLRNEFVIFAFQWIPALFIDLFAGSRKGGHVIVEIQRRYAKGIKYTSYFSVREWRFERPAADALIQLLPREERDQHPMDPRLIDWDSYFENCVIGTRTYFHKEAAKTTDKARRQLAALRVIAALTPLLSFTAICCVLVLLLGAPWILAAAIAAFVVSLLVWI